VSKDRVRDALLQRAEAEVFRTNPFRILRLPVNASFIQIQRRIQEIKMQQQIGIQQPNDPLLPPTHIDDADLQKLSHRLQDPVERLADELLWFWSANTDGSDDALTALWDGDVGNAIALWQEMAESENSFDIAVGFHNLALIYHLLALELELRGRCQVERKQWEACWQQAWVYWQEVIEEDDVWNYLDERVKELNDPRADSEVIEIFRETIPLFLALINAKLAVQASQKESKEIVKFHCELLKEFSDHKIREIALAYATKPLLEQIRASLQSARQKEKDQSPAETAEWLINSTRQPLKVLEDVFPDSLEVSDLRDEIALQLRGWANASVVPDDTVSLEKAIQILNYAIALAGTKRVKEQIKEEVEEAKCLLELKPILDRLAALLNEAKKKADRGDYYLWIFNMNEAEWLIKEAEPLLNQLDRLTSKALDQLKIKCHDAVAVTIHMLIASAIKAGNKDFQRAKVLLERAKRISMSPEVISFLLLEIESVNKLIAYQQAKMRQLTQSLAKPIQMQSERMKGYGCLLLFVIIAWVVINNWLKSRDSKVAEEPMAISSHSETIQSKVPKNLLPSKTSIPKTSMTYWLYTAREGEIPEEIARRFNVSVTDILRANPNLVADQPLRQGEVVLVPVKESSSQKGYPETKDQWIKYLSLEKHVRDYMQGHIKLSGDLESLLANITYKDSTIYPDKETYGDLDGDKKKEKVIIVRINAGGSGTFVYLIVLKNGKFIDTVCLGDRVIINSLKIEKRKIILNMLTHGPNDPMANPTKKTIIKYRLKNNHLVSEQQERLEWLKQRINQLKNKIEQGQERLRQISDHIIELDKQIKDLLTTIENIRSEIQVIEQTHPLGFSSILELESYRALIRKHNEYVVQYNSLVAQRNALVKEGLAIIESFRKKAIEHDRLVNEYESLSQSGW